MNITQEAIDLIKEFEGLRLTTYTDSAGVLTIGYGTTAAAGVGIRPQPGMTITEDEAEEYLKRALAKFSQQIIPLFKVTPNANQFGAFLSLAYNIGPGAFGRSTALKRFNAGEIQGAAEALTWFNKAGGKVLRGLVRRREAERQLFLSEPMHRDAAVVPDEPRRSPVSSTTNWTALTAFLAALSTFSDMVKGVVASLADNLGITPEQALGLVVMACAAWIFRERMRHWFNGVR